MVEQELFSWCFLFLKNECFKIYLLSEGKYIQKKENTLYFYLL